MNQLITIALLFCLSFTMGLLRASAVLNYPAVRQSGGAIVEQQMKGIFEAQTRSLLPAVSEKHYRTKHVYTNLENQSFIKIALGEKNY